MRNIKETALALVIALAAGYGVYASQQKLNYQNWPWLMQKLQPMEKQETQIQDQESK